MSKVPGLGVFVLIFGIFALTFNSWVVSTIPVSGIGSVVFSAQTFFLLASVIVMKIAGLGIHDVGLSKHRLRRNTSIGVAAGLAPIFLVLITIGALTMINMIVPFLPRPFWGGESTHTTFPIERLFIFLIWAPITEELFFRGLLLRSIRKSYAPFLAVAFSSIIFMVGHGGFAPGPLILGFVTGYLTLYTGSIWPGIFYHSISNAYGPILIKWFPNLMQYLEFFYN